MLAKTFRLPYIRNIITLSGGVMIAQILGVISAPLITRLFDPMVYGVFGIYSAWFLLLSNIATGRYHIASVVEQDEMNARQLRQIAFITNMLVSTIVFVITVSLAWWLSDQWHWLWLLAIGTWGVGLIQTFESDALRTKNFKTIAAAQIIQTGFTVFTQIICGYYWPVAYTLILGNVFGLFMAVFYLYRQNIISPMPVNINYLRHLYIRAWQNRSFPLFSMSANLLQTTARMLPGLLFPLFGWQHELSYVFLAFKVCYMPIVLIAQSIAQVFLSRFSGDGHDINKIRNNLLRMYLWLLLPTVPVVLLFQFFASELCQFAFGKNWYAAGDYLRFLAIWFGVHFVTYPATMCFDIEKKQNMNFVVSTLMLITQVAIIFFAYYSHLSPLIAVKYYSIGNAIILIGQAIVIHRFLLNKQVQC